MTEEHNRGETISGIGINNVKASRSYVETNSKNIEVDRSNANYNGINTGMNRNPTCVMWKGLTREQHEESVKKLRRSMNWQHEESMEKLRDEVEERLKRELEQVTSSVGKR